MWKGKKLKTLFHCRRIKVCKQLFSFSPVVQWFNNKKCTKVLSFFNTSSSSGPWESKENKTWTRKIKKEKKVPTTMYNNHFTQQQQQSIVKPFDQQTDSLKVDLHWALYSSSSRGEGGQWRRKKERKKTAYICSLFADRLSSSRSGGNSLDQRRRADLDNDKLIWTDIGLKAEGEWTQEQLLPGTTDEKSPADNSKQTT